MASVWAELKRRNVVKVAVAYAVVGWLLIEVASTVFPIVQLPDWTVTFVTMLLILGFPVALILSWAYELTPEGMKRNHEVPASESITHVTGRKIDFAIIGSLVLALGFVVYNYVLNAPATSPIVEQDRPSVAALPFSNESAAEENAEFFANGIHDELLTQLAKISSLKVISRTSVMEYRATTKNMREIGQELGVATLLEGRVQRAGDMVRINVQLIDAETDEHLWAEIYNRELTAENIFAIQGEMATSIAAALEATLSPQDVARLNELPTENTRAYDFYLSGNDYYNRPDDETYMPLAVEQYQRAVDEDPDFALAWAALSRAHGLMRWYGLDISESRLELAREAVETAIRLAPGLPEAHLALGQYHYQGFRDYDRALAEYAIAEQGIRGSADLFQARAMIYRRVGQYAEAEASLERAIELDPRNTDRLAQLATTHLSHRDYSQGEHYLDRVLEITPDDAAAYSRKALIPLRRDGDVSVARAAAESPRAVAGRFFLGWIAAIYERDYDAALGYLDDWDGDVDLGQSYIPKAAYYGATYRLAGQPELAEREFEAARRQVEEALRASPDDHRLVVAMGEAMVGLGQQEEGVSLARQAMELLPTSRDTNSGPWVHLDAILRVMAPAGDYDAVIEELDAYLAGPGPWSIEGLLPDPRVDPIRDDPRFRVLVERYRRQ